VPAAHESVPDVALLDVQMPGKDELAAAGELHKAVPACRILICTTSGRPGYLLRAMAAGPPVSSSRTHRRKSSWT
jgi:two-component system response regulator DesR